MAHKFPMYNGQNIDNDHVEIALDADDAYDVRCGEVFITLNRVLVFHCSLCDSKYASSDYFLEHLSTHYKKIYYEVKEDDIESNKSENELKGDLSAQYNFKELCEEPENEDEYEKLLQMHDFTEDDIKAEFVNIEEEHLDEFEQGIGEHDSYFEKALSESDELQSEYGSKLDLDISSLKRKDLDSSSPLPISKDKKQDLIQCDQCNKRFETKQKLRKHTITHSVERKHKCKICGFAFKERSNLKAHEHRHTGQKKIGCSLCPKKFFTRSESETHMRTHTGERPFICSYCGMAFTTSGGLSEHVKRHNNDRPHKCNFCDKRFYDSCQLRDHMPVHTHERPFVCTICSANFARRKSLLVHTKLHINAKEYECNLCDKSFNQKPALLAHIKINHKVIEATKINEFS